MYNYVFSFVNNGVGGHQLLNIRPYELEQLGMDSIGHQEIVLEAVENLRNFVSSRSFGKEKTDCELVSPAALQPRQGELTIYGFACGHSSP